ncbi:DUF4369 domain-containing protein [Antarcticibacterium flavum]|uniref:DUF4369 domain-containing protein n=1 Tax=Antarcticibacterium flavum TaxID=2058175 RepID=A0A5B7X7R2_9FLAO|nr:MULTISPECIES: DUF4369 domain-containing protein [Antarcticibacterium]MCM4159750.1 hypothetical protein [Antarcticibacterium sp. W02-3]QCY70683.1 DUF4369 domain-containing protein [Antarcticibacterium flavum]
MKKICLLFVLILTAAACSKKESNLIVKGNIEGLKKGVLYLQKIEDTLLVNVDSVVIRGDANFILEDYISSPQMMYLYLDKVDNLDYEERIEFFAEEGEITVITSLKNFETDAKVIGSANQEKLDEYKKMMRRFNDRNLELIQQNFEAQRDENEDLLMATNQEYDRLLKRKYLYTVNFAINNKDLELAPYLALSEVFDANIKYLDTIFNSMTPEVKKSRYGKELKDFLKERRKLEKEEANIEEQ